MAVPTVDQLFKQLSELTTPKRDDDIEVDYERVISLCDSILAQVPDDVDVVRCKVISLLKLSKPEAALSVLESWKLTNEELKQQLVFEHAFSLYSLKRFSEALRLIESSRTSTTTKQYSRKLLLLKAQIQYRLESFGDCVRSFEQTCEETQQQQQQQSNAFVSNLLSAQSEANDHSSAAKLISSLSQDCQESHECCFNAACHHIGCGQWSQARSALQQAHSLCEKQLQQQELSEEDKESVQKDLHVIEAQMAFVEASLGNNSSALESYSNLLKKAKQGTDVSAISAINKNALESSLSSSTAPIDPESESRLSTRQKVSNAWNRCVQLLRSKQISQQQQQQLTEATKSYLAIEGGSIKAKERVCVLIAIYLKNNLKLGEAINSLKAFAIENKDQQQCSTAAFVLSQMLYDDNKFSEAADVLDELLPSSIRSKLGVCSMIINLRIRSGDSAKIVSSLEDCASRYRSIDSTICRKIASILSSRDEHSKATAIYESLENQQKDKQQQNPIVDYARMEALTRTNLNRAEQLCQTLPPIAPLPEGITIESLEGLSSSTLKHPAAATTSTPITPSTTANKTVSSEEEKKKIEARKKKKQSKKKKWRQAKVKIMPGIPLDPERWKPKRERSGYRVRGKGRVKRDQQLARGLPGAQNVAQEQALATTTTTTAPKQQNESKQQRRPRKR